MVKLIDIAGETASVSCWPYGGPRCIEPTGLSTPLFGLECHLIAGFRRQVAGVTLATGEFYGIIRAADSQVSPDDRCLSSAFLNKRPLDF
jgi:hypothetical protein